MDAGSENAATQSTLARMDAGSENAAVEGSYDCGRDEFQVGQL